MMRQIEIIGADRINSLQAILVHEWMDQRHPTLSWTMQPGQDCIWVYWGSTVPMNLYFTFCDGKIADVIVD